MLEMTVATSAWNNICVWDDLAYEAVADEE
jgi:hypothetical protein